MFDFNRELMGHVLNVPSEKFRDKTIESLRDYMTTMKDELGENNLPSSEEAMNVLTEEFVNLLDSPAHADHLTEEEEAESERLTHKLFDPQFVFQNEGWTTLGRKIRDGVYLYEGLYKTPTGLIRMIWIEQDKWIENIWLGGDLLIDPQDGLSRLGADLTRERFLVSELADRLAASFAAVPLTGLTPSDLLEAYKHRLSLVPEDSASMK